MFISAVSADGVDKEKAKNTTEKQTIQHIQVQQEKIHKKLVHIEAQLSSPN